MAKGNQDSNNNDDLSDVLNVFKDALETPINSSTTNSIDNNNNLVNKRREHVLDVNRKTKLEQYPSTMSCTTAFDEVFSCYSVGGQMRSYYRYGELNNCTEAYDKFLFCVSNTMSRKSEEQKKNEVRKFYKKQFLLKKAKGSSEDVWEVRK